MKKKISELFKTMSKNYYDFNPNNLEQNLEQNSKKDIIAKLKIIEKENEILKSELKVSTLEKIKNRRSIRKFSNKKIPLETIYNIIEAGLNAPAAGNIQNSNVIVIFNEEDKRELGKLSFQQYWLAEAPVLLVVVRDNYRLMQLYPQEGEIYSVQNSAALIENMLLYTHFCDLGACWVEAYDNEVLKEFLEVPSNMTVDAIIPIGYPLENPKIAKEPALNKIFFKKWNNRKRPRKI